ncbi:vWA domain-containing protein [Alteromonas sp. BMJM2]|uniref:vWA domain-containing protein n=1 Tax=Alteromonas sp. BMJM2 TaxID=2954241 RepID=UPI0022B5089B|nr:VWA-like domain-containing protein [Alteromonas sp. BMJM2]
MQTEELTNALDAAKIQLISRPNSVFLTTILFSLRFNWSERTHTSQTNGVYLLVNPNYFMTLRPTQRIAFLAKAAYRVALQHPIRGKGKDYYTWKSATEYIVTDLLIKQGFDVPDTWNYHEDFENKTSEEAYDIVVEKAKQAAKESWEDDDDWFDEETGEILDFSYINSTVDEAEDDFDTPQDDDGIEWAEIESETIDTIQRASILAEQADGWGDVPGEVKIFLDNLLSPKMPWHKILSKHMTDLAKVDYSFERPNRRYLPDTYLPTQNSESLTEITVAVDVSGSVGPGQIDQFISEIHAIHTQLKPTKTTVLGFNTDITTTTTIEEAADVLNIELKGDGGTNITPVMEYAVENKPKALVVFTDGHFGFDENEVPRDVPVYWIIEGNSDFSTKRGKVIHFEV